MARNHLHQDLIVEILARLPVKSLVRFKSLSKAYHTLITTNKNFITKHFNNSTAKNQTSLVVFHKEEDISVTLVSDDKLSQPPIDLSPPSPFPDQFPENIIAYGPCNGILCLQVSCVGNPIRLMLWNPATREVKTLPLPHLVYISAGKYFGEVYGLGVDPITNNFKVVHLVTGEFGMRDIIQPTAQVYSLSTNSWNTVNVPVPTYDVVEPSFTSYMNGVYHWLIRPDNDESILCFNMSNNVFWKMNLPPVSQGDTNEMLVESNVAILKDSVAYIKEYKLSSPLGTRVEIWVMNDYGVEESWTKRFNIVPPHLEQLKFWCFWNDDEALLTGQDFKPLVSHNINVQQALNDVPIPVGEVLHAFRYVESVVSLSNLVEEEA